MRLRPGHHPLFRLVNQLICPVLNPALIQVAYRQATLPHCRPVVHLVLRLNSPALHQRVSRRFGHQESLVLSLRSNPALRRAVYRLAILPHYRPVVHLVFRRRNPV